MLNICERTERTISPYDGYIVSPYYPEKTPPENTPGQREGVCQCRISAVSTGGIVELLVADAQTSDMVSETIHPLNRPFLVHPSLMGQSVQKIDNGDLPSTSIFE